MPPHESRNGTESPSVRRSPFKRPMPETVSRCSTSPRVQAWICSEAYLSYMEKHEYDGPKSQRAGQASSPFLGLGPVSSRSVHEKPWARVAACMVCLRFGPCISTTASATTLASHLWYRGNPPFELLHFQSGRDTSVAFCQKQQYI